MCLFLVVYVFLCILQGNNEKMEEPVDIDNINDDNVANAYNDNLLNNYLNGKQNLTS